MMTREAFVVRHTAPEIQTRVADLAGRLGPSHQDHGLLVVGVLKGTTMLLADLVRQLSCPVRFEFIDVERVDQSDPAGEPRIAIRFMTRFQVTDQDVLLLKDVVTTGVVESYLLSQLRAQSPRSLQLACVVDRRPARRVSLEVDHPLFVEPEAELWVGYGLDAGLGRFAQLPDLAVLVDANA